MRCKHCDPDLLETDPNMQLCIRGAYEKGEKPIMFVFRWKDGETMEGEESEEILLSKKAFEALRDFGIPVG